MSTISRGPLHFEPSPRSLRGRDAPVRRTGTRAEPPVARWELAGAADGDTDACARALDVLDTLRRAAWLELGGRMLSFHAAGEWEAAFDALGAPLDEHRLAMTAWLVRDAVRTMVHLAPRDVARPTGGRRRSPRPDTAQERAAVDAACRAAAAAALARLVQPWLPKTHLAVLVAPLQAAVASHLVRGRETPD